MRPTILSCAVTGSHTTREHNGTLPACDTLDHGAALGRKRHVCIPHDAMDA